MNDRPKCALKKPFPYIYVMILWFICVLVLARTGFIFAAARRVHGLDIILSHLTSLSGAERSGSLWLSGPGRGSHRVLSGVGGISNNIIPYSLCVSRYL